MKLFKKLAQVVKFFRPMVQRKFIRPETNMKFKRLAIKKVFKI